jgi:addiction module RelE/StbE family toxin
MAKKIDWSERARRELFEILAYWSNRNKSKVYSKKLNQLFLEDVERLSETPEIGKPTRFLNVRMIIVRDYLVYYKIHTLYIEIITIWDSRRDPEKFTL